MADTIYCKDCECYRATDIRSVKHFCIGSSEKPPTWTGPYDTCKYAIKKKEKDNAR